VVLLVGLLGAMMWSLTGCSSGPGTMGPTGVDELTIPTPSPDPDDFVDEVDNRWLPLEPGTTWTYSLDDATEPRTVTVEVGTDTREIAGVATTPVTTTTTDEGDLVLGASTAWYAQDASGNVWLFGEELGPSRLATSDGGSWVAGEDGAEAGLAMAAAPRVGDGYRRSAASGVSEDVVTVQSVDESLSTVNGLATEVVLTEQQSSLDSEVVLRWYAPGVGLVRQSSATQPTWTLRSIR
jgi:hypothetical protein